MRLYLELRLIRSHPCNTETIQSWRDNLKSVEHASHDTKNGHDNTMGAREAKLQF